MFRQWWKGTTSPRRIRLPWIEIRDIPDLRLKVGQVVELKEKVPGARDGDFLSILSILHNIETDQVLLRGLLLKRCKSTTFRGMVPKKRNELCVVLHVDEHDSRSHFVQSLQDIPLRDVQKGVNGRPLRREVIFTNQIYPTCSYRDINTHHHVGPDVNGSYSPGAEDNIDRYSILVCRWIYSKYAENSTRTQGRCPWQTSFRRFMQSEGDEKHRVPDHLLVLNWRGCLADPAGRITLADGFCGGGLVSQGAKNAGVTVVLGFDNDEVVLGTWKLNNPGAIAHTRRADEMIALYGMPIVSIMHLSPPCQAYSRMNSLAGTRDPNTAAGMRDEANSAASFCIDQMLLKFRPRVMTMEQTSGIFDANKRTFLERMIGQFTDAGYSVYWKRLNMADYGNPHARDRVIIIASCPGGVLPSFPARTHGPPGSGLKPWVTINQSIRKVPRGYPFHNAVTYEDGIWPGGDRPLRACVMTNGTAEKHPSGRTFTDPELMTLQTIPLQSFRFPPFSTSGQRRHMIGNGVPCLPVKRIYTSIVGTMRTEEQTWAALEYQNNADRDDSRARSATIGRDETGGGAQTGDIVDLTNDDDRMVVDLTDD